MLIVQGRRAPGAGRPLLYCTNQRSGRAVANAILEINKHGNRRQGTVNI